MDENIVKNLKEKKKTTEIEEENKNSVDEQKALKFDFSQLQIFCNTGSKAKINQINEESSSSKGFSSSYHSKFESDNNFEKNENYNVKI